MLIDVTARLIAGRLRAMIRTLAAVVVTMRVATAASTLLFASAIWLGSSAHAAEETSHLAFVTEYVRELIANENVRDAALQERKRSADPTLRRLRELG
jgi:hypothetical protein